MKTHLLLFFTILSFTSISTNLVAMTINPSMYKIDDQKKIILINQSIDDLNNNLESPLNAITLEDEYSFDESINSLEIGKAYSVTDITSSEKYKLYITELPIIHITTENTIVDEPRVLAHFNMVENDGTITDSNIGIEYRGGTSQSYPKKSLRIEFWEAEDDTETKDVSLLGLRSDDDWNLQAMYNEPLRMGNKTTHDLWRKINELHYKDDEPEAINGVRMKYVELFINNEYRGVYCVGERIDRKQLKLKKYKDEVRGELYKGVGWGASTYTNCPPIDNSLDVWSGFELEYPDEISIDWSLIFAHVDFIVNSSSSKFNHEYESRIVVSNAIDYFIFLNLIRATDNTGKNLYVAKYTKGTPYFFVPWDLDGVFGTIWDGTQEDVTNDILTNGLYKKLREDSKFNEQLNKRWEELRNKDIINTSKIMNSFYENHDFLKNNAVYEREEIAWNQYQYDSDQLDYMEDWLARRITFLDEEFSYTPNSIESAILGQTQISIDPASNSLTIATNLEESLSIKIIDLHGKTIKTVLPESNSNINISLDGIPNGIYMVSMQTENYQKTEKIIIGG